MMRPSLEMQILATNDPYGMLGPEFSTLKKYLTKTKTGKEGAGGCLPGPLHLFLI